MCVGVRVCPYNNRNLNNELHVLSYNNRNTCSSGYELRNNTLSERKHNTETQQTMRLCDGVAHIPDLARQFVLLFKVHVGMAGLHPELPWRPRRMVANTELGSLQNISEGVISVPRISSAVKMRWS